MEYMSLIATVTVVCAFVTQSALTEKSQGSSTKSRISRPSITEDTHNWNDEGPTEEEVKRTRAKCVAIPQTMTLCRGIGYLQMRLPNLLGHETLTEVQQAAGSWTPLLSTQCSPNTKLFLCSLFSPVCLDQPIWPCRSLCHEVKRGCEARMASHGYPWPPMLNCERFPSDDALCIGLQSNSSSSSRSGRQMNCKVCETIDFSTNTFMEKYCQSDFVAKIRPKMAVITGRDLKIIPTKVKFFKAPSAAIPDKHRQAFYIQDGASCDCFDLSTASSAPDRTTVQYLVMGHLLDKYQMTLTSMVKYDSRSKTGRQMLRAMKNSDRCHASDWRHQNIMSDTSEKYSSEKKPNKKNRKKQERKTSGMQVHKTLKKGFNKNQKERRRKASLTNKKSKQNRKNWKEYN